MVIASGFYGVRFQGHLAIFADMKPRQRVEILLCLLGSQQRVTLASTGVELIP